MIYENAIQERNKLIKVMSEVQANEFYEFAQKQQAVNCKERRVKNRVLDIANYQDRESVFWAQNPEKMLIDKENRDEFWARFDEAFKTLTPTQQRRFLLHALDPKKNTYAEIARKEGVDPSSVKESIEAAQKKLKKFY